ncbi:MAG: adenosine deaminase [Chloroflexi bacterium]|nr:adenosine deaminase [Chloroflexota bacterium]MDA1227128.1 adenosine deaminase [Chloroflexota bacterium]
MSTTTDWFDKVPKVELHLHLEGAIPRPALWELMQKYGGDPSVPDMEALDKKFTYADFPEFIQAWIWKNQFLREYEDFSYFSEAFARELVRQNIRYAEAFFSPVRFTEVGLETSKLFEAVRQGLNKVPEVEVALIADLVRDYGPEQAVTTLQEIQEARDNGIVGIGIGGSEHNFPPELFTDAYDQARGMGFHVTAHAGEAAGAESVWGAIRHLKAERIGHGVRSHEDEALLDHLAESKIPLEMCPHSNVCTQIVDSIEAHPVKDYFDRGIMVTVNTDDPGMFGNTLSGEFRLLHERLGFSQDEVRQVILNGIQATWLSEGRKAALKAEFTSDEAWAG